LENERPRETGRVPRAEEGYWPSAGVGVASEVCWSDALESDGSDPAFGVCMGASTDVACMEGESWANAKPVMEEKHAAAERAKILFIFFLLEAECHPNGGEVLGFGRKNFLEVSVIIRDPRPARQGLSFGGIAVWGALKFPGWKREGVFRKAFLFHSQKKPRLPGRTRLCRVLGGFSP
jgi:hypothetical protein